MERKRVYSVDGGKSEKRLTGAEERLLLRRALSLDLLLDLGVVLFEVFGVLCFDVALVVASNTTVLCFLELVGGEEALRPRGLESETPSESAAEERPLLLWPSVAVFSSASSLFLPRPWPPPRTAGAAATAAELPSSVFAESFWFSICLNLASKSSPSAGDLPSSHLEMAVC